MSDTHTEDTFWSASPGFLVVTRRVAFPFAKKRGELTISIPPEQPVRDVARLGGASLKEAVAPSVSLKPHAIVEVMLTYADVRKGPDGELVVTTGEGRDVPVTQIPGTQPVKSAYDIETLMARAKVALSTAVLAEGDHAVGFLYKTDVLRFYPLLSINLPEEIESYHDGEANSDDVIPLLPFQS